MRSPLLFIALLCASSLLRADEGRFFRQPDIRGERIAFSYEGDLWTAPAGGGTATRLTTAPGIESFPKFSPDGRWIAFTGSYDGSQQVYLLAAGGGVPKRVTYLPSTALCLGWTPDGTRILFRSSFESVVSRDPKLYSILPDGTGLERLPVDRGVRAAFSPDGKSMIYARRGDEEYYWKRYKGGQYQDLWKVTFAGGAYAPVSDYVGKNAYPMWVGDTLYFVSDRGNGISNLFAQNLTTRAVTPVTACADVDVMMPSTDGRRIIYVQNGYLHVFTVATGADVRLAVDTPGDRWALRPRTINPRDYLHSAEIAGDGGTVVLEARGDLFVVPVGKGTPRNLSQTPGTREMYPALSPDGKSIAFFSDRSGEYQLYTQRVEGGAWTPITTSLDRTAYHPVWSPDGKKLLFGTKDFTLIVVDLASKALTPIAESRQLKNDEFSWEISDYDWSPDSRWVAYTAVAFNRNSQVFLYDLSTGKTHTLTTDFYDNLHPRFDPSGEYLYYLSSRNFDVQMDYMEDNHILSAPQQVMAVQLRSGQAPPFADAPSPAKGARTEPFRIDLEGLADRTYPLPVPAGNFFSLRAAKGKVLWTSVPRFTDAEYDEMFAPAGETKWDLHLFDMDQKKEVVLADHIRDVQVSRNGEQLVIRRDADVWTSSVEKAFQSKTCGDKLDLAGLAYTVDTQAEWNQIFSDTWRWYRDFFYDAKMHGRDWKAMGDFYRAYIPQLSSRTELNWMLSQMVGELCVSHSYVSGGDLGPQTAPVSPVSTGLLGADLVPDKTSGFYRFGTIYGPTDVNRNLTGPLVRPDLDIKEGDYLLAINGTPLRVPEDYFRLLQVTAGQKVTLKVNRTPSSDGAKSYEVTPVRSDAQLRYFRWLSNNIATVSARTGGRVGYMHINAMGAGGIAEFDKFWRAFRTKDGLIIDVRRNSGGWTEYFLIDKLERKMVAYNVLKGMVPFRYPGTASVGHYVAISNEDNGSDGEAFIEHFKARKLGTVVGTPSWGGLVGIVNARQTIDNGSINQPNNAFYGREGTWLVENHGADPDVVVDNDPASVMAGKDPQLDRAIEVVLRKIAEAPFSFPPVPPYPTK